jgi:hypothetical protein
MRLTNISHIRILRKKNDHVAEFAEVKDNGFNLNIPGYVDTFEEEDEIDIDDTKNLRMMTYERMTIDGDDFYLDLLFYHRKLKRLVAIELKMDWFKDAFKGQMELYLNSLNKDERQEGIGLNSQL